MIDPIFNMFKIRFEKLDTYSKLSKKKTRVFINLEMVLKLLLTPRVSEYCKSISTVELERILVSNIINLAQHYRLYLTKLHIPNEVYLYWNFPIVKKYNNDKYIEKYRSLYNEKITDDDTDCIVDTLERIHGQLRTIINYVNEVYLLDGGMVDSGVIPYLIAKEHSSQICQNILVTNNRYEFQYIKHGFRIWFPDREDSMELTEANIFLFMKEKLNLKSKDIIPINYLPFVISLLGDRYRGITKIKGIGLAKAVKLVNSSLENGIITPTTSSIELLKRMFSEEQQDTFVRNYKCTDVEYQYAEISMKQESKILDQIIDKYDDDSLYYLNDKFFKDHLIMIIDTKRDQIVKYM